MKIKWKHQKTWFLHCKFVCGNQLRRKGQCVFLWLCFSSLQYSRLAAFSRHVSRFARWRCESRAANDPPVFIITEKAPTRSFSWLKAPISAFTFKIQLRHYAKKTLMVSKCEIGTVTQRLLYPLWYLCALYGIIWFMVSNTSTIMRRQKLYITFQKFPQP